MKTAYQFPEIEVLVLSESDVLRTSVDPTDLGTIPTYDWENL